jgi:hypothetical protein
MPQPEIEESKRMNRRNFFTKLFGGVTAASVGVILPAAKRNRHSEYERVLKALGPMTSEEQYAFLKLRLRMMADFKSDLELCTRIAPCVSSR